MTISGILLTTASYLLIGCSGGGNGITGDVHSELDSHDALDALPDSEDSVSDSSAEDTPADEFECVTIEDCDDANPCTVDSCSPFGACEYSGLDADGDDFLASHAPSGEECGGLDCDDTNDSVYPGAEDWECDDIDKNCNGTNQEHIDDDGDGWIEYFCWDEMEVPVGYEGIGDCDDEADWIHPGAVEYCNYTDEDCDGSVFDAPEADDDGDEYLDDICYLGDDCNDEDDTIYPMAPEDGCDWVDNDCDGDELDGFADQDDDGHMNDACSGGDDCDDLDPTIWTGC